MRPASHSLAFAALLAAGWLSVSCGSRPEPGTPPDAGGAPVKAPKVMSARPPAMPAPRQGERCRRDCLNFPAAPLLVGKVPSDPGSGFPDDPRQLSKPLCVLEPALGDTTTRPGVMYPPNGLAPRFRWRGTDPLWQIRLSHKTQANELLVYTTETSWRIPSAVWKAAAGNLSGAPVTVTIRGVSGVGVVGTFEVAPDAVAGSIVYRATTSRRIAPDESRLLGLRVGDAAPIEVLTLGAIQTTGILDENGKDLRGVQRTLAGFQAGQVQCIGCHVPTPSGEATAFTDHRPWNTVVASVREQEAGEAPPYLTGGARLLLNMPWQGMPTMTPAFWKPGARLVVTSFKERAAPWQDVRHERAGLAWVNLEAEFDFSAGLKPADPSNPFMAKGGDQVDPVKIGEIIETQKDRTWGVLALEGEARSALGARWSHNGEFLVYSSAEQGEGGRVGSARRGADIRRVPYQKGKGGRVVPIEGASLPGVAEYYPDLSPDDRLVAFTRVASSSDVSLYYRPEGELYVALVDGGAALRLAANDPPACSGETSPGVINSWPRFAPETIRNEEAAQYYFLVFSSARKYEGQFELGSEPGAPVPAGVDTRSSQLYIAAVRRSADGKLTSYPALYLYNQNPASSNLTPAWDDIQIPRVPSP